MCVHIEGVANNENSYYWAKEEMPSVLLKRNFPTLSFDKVTSRLRNSLRAAVSKLSKP